MPCKYCGKPIEENSSFCSSCGKDLSVVNVDVPKISLEETKSDTESSTKTAKLILSFVIGMVLSFITALLLIYGSLIWLIIGIGLWVVFFGLIRQIATSMTGSDGIGILGGLIGGFVLMWIATTLLTRYAEGVDDASNTFSLFLKLLPLTLIFTFIVYTMASAADKKKDNSTKNSR